MCAHLSLSSGWSYDNMVVHATFKYVVPWLKCQHLHYTLVLTFKPWGNVSECHTHDLASSVYCHTHDCASFVYCYTLAGAVAAER